MGTDRRDGQGSGEVDVTWNWVKKMRLHSMSRFVWDMASGERPYCSPTFEAAPLSNTLAYVYVTNETAAKWRKPRPGLWRHGDMVVKTEGGVHMSADSMIAIGEDMYVVTKVERRRWALCSIDEYRARRLFDWRKPRWAAP